MSMDQCLSCPQIIQAQISLREGHAAQVVPISLSRNESIRSEIPAHPNKRAGRYLQGRTTEFTGTFSSELDIARGWLPKGAQCKGTKS